MHISLRRENSLLEVAHQEEMNGDGVRAQRPGDGSDKEV